MIPKIIHYCWFGGNPLPPLAQKCIKSWKKYCPDYEIVRWDESNFDINGSLLYVKQAYDKKMWAFVSDYVRPWALVNYGGIYMDTDVELVRPIDCFLQESAFSGFEAVDRIPTGIMACEKDHSTFKEWLNEYSKKRFVLDDGSVNLETNVTAITNYMARHGFSFDNALQTVKEVTFYPKDFFCPKDTHTGIVELTGSTYCIHHFNGSWVAPTEKKKTKARWRKYRIERIKNSPKILLRKLIGDDRVESIKRFLRRK